MNKLFYGDNLDVLRRHIAAESVDLVYLDPPFNSETTYNVLFRDGDDKRAESQLRAFGDTWTWNEDSSRAYQAAVEKGGQLSQALQALRTFLGDDNLMAYLAMMAPRLVELHRVLKPTGSLYLHCDPIASHYLKMLLDAIFGVENFKNEISWRRTTTKNDHQQGATNFPRVRDTIFYYSKQTDAPPKFHQPFAPYSAEYLNTKYRYKDESNGRLYRLDNLTAPGAGTRGHPKYELMGVTRYWRYNEAKMRELLAAGRVMQTKPGTVPQYKRYLDEMAGIAVGDSWEDIDPINSQAQERLGYQTQKPEALLDRIIKANTDEGDVVLDPFCGCGTAIASAHRLKRQWIGIDITQAAIVVIKQRFRDHFGIEVPCSVIGEPASVSDAMVLARSDPYQFQWWALGLVGARPTDGKKGADHGIDGRRYFSDPTTGKTHQIVFSVKAGHVSVSHLRDLRGVLDREKASMGAIICMEDPTKPMRAEAVSAGSVDTAWGRYPRLQIRSVAELLSGNKLDAPNPLDVTYKQAPRVVSKVAEQQVEFTLQPKLPMKKPTMVKAHLPLGFKQPKARQASKHGR